jgi:hypothetical protein
MNRQDVESLLRELCVDLGFCLPPDRNERLVDSPPDDVDAFTDAVFIAEGLDPSLIEKGLRGQVRHRVERAFYTAAMTPADEGRSGR